MKEFCYEQYASNMEAYRRFGRLAEEIKLKWARIAHIYVAQRNFFRVVWGFLAPSVRRSPERIFRLWLRETRDIQEEALNLSNYYHGLFLEEEKEEKEKEEKKWKRKILMRREKRRDKRREERRRRKEREKERKKKEERRKRRKEEKERRKKRKEEEKNLNN